MIPYRVLRNVGGTRFEEVTLSGGVGHLQNGHAVALADLEVAVAGSGAQQDELSRPRSAHLPPHHAGLGTDRAAASAGAVPEDRTWVAGVDDHADATLAEQRNAELHSRRTAQPQNCYIAQLRYRKTAQPQKGTAAKGHSRKKATATD